MKRLSIALLLILSLVFMTACGNSNTDNDSEGEETKSSSEKVLKIGAIPDFNTAELTRAFDDFAEYLSKELGIKVEYVPTVDYASLVTAFERGDINMAWFGGLTGVQAFNLVPDAQAIAQRPQDAEFKSVFIKHEGIDVENIEDLKGHTFTFGSESSTSGHLMPRYFMEESGINPEEDINGGPNYSGSHDKTYKLVESGAFETGAVNMQYWDQAVSEGKVDTSKVQEFYRTDDYYDYNFTVSNLDKEFGEGTTEKMKSVLLNMKPEDSEVMKLLSADKFIETENSNYEKIEKVAKQLGLVK